jgi:hypothetical protein
MKETSESVIQLTCLMPCLNEAETLALCISQAQKSIESLGISGEVLIADNGSSDGSQQIASDLGARVIAVERRGYGSALQAGIAAAEGKYVVMGDADGSYTWDKLEAIYGGLVAGSDLVMGNRFAGTIFPNAMPAMNRYVGNPLLSGLGRLFFSIKIRDFHCGLRGFNRKRMLELDISSPGMEFASEMVIKSSLSSLKISEVPTDLRPDGRSRAPHLRPLPDGWRHLRLMLSYSPKWSMRIPGIVLLILGITAAGLGLLTDPTTNRVSFGLHTALIGAAFIVSGVQAIFSSMIGEMAISNSISIEPSSALLRMQQSGNIEKILLTGAALSLIGFLAILYSFFNWRGSGFSELAPDEMMKILLPGVTLLIVGVQVLFSAFLFETLRRAK